MESGARSKSEAADGVPAPRDRADFLNVILDTLVEGVLCLDREGCCTYCNAAALDLLGLDDATKLLGRPVHPLIHHSRADGSPYPLDECALCRTARTGRSAQGDDAVFWRADGSRFEAEFRASPLRQEGITSGSVLSFRDIGRRRLAERRLVQSERQLRELLGFLPQLAWTCNAERECEFLSPQWLAYTGVPEHDQLGGGWLACLHDVDRSRLEAAWRDAARDGSRLDVECRIRRADGAYRWFRTLANPVRDTDGHIVKWFGLNTVIEDQVHARETAQLRHDDLRQDLQRQSDELTLANRELRDSRRMLEAIHQAETRFIVEESGPDVFADMLRTLLEMSGSTAGCIQELGRTTDGQAVLTQRAAQALAENGSTDADRLPDLEALCREAVDSRRAVIGGARGGNAPPFLGLPLYSAGLCVGAVGLSGRPGGYGHQLVRYLRPLLTSCGSLLVAWRNVQKRNEAEESLRRQNIDLVRQKEQLKAANRELEAFSYSVSHDLRSPLRSVDAFSRILLEEFAPQLDPEGRRIVGIVRGEAQRMGMLIDDLLHFSRTGRQTLDARHVDLAELARQVYDDLTSDSRSHVRDFHVGPLPPAYGDRTMLRQVLANLIGNAVKFTATTDDARIELGTAERDGAHFYYVRDNGVGFDPRYQHKLFGVFQRLHAEEEFEGTGVGLAIVQRIVHRHGGSVMAEGALDRGATFYFSLPHSQGDMT